jgi:hypothetical protein
VVLNNPWFLGAPAVYLTVKSFLAVMGVVAIANAILSRVMLKLSHMDALILGAAMGLLTAPWLVLAWKYYEWMR